MADSDSFVQEVTEEVRRDAMYAAWKKYGPWVVGLLLIIIVGTAARAWWTNHQTEQMRERGGAYLAAQGIEDSAGSAEAFHALSGETEGDFAALAGLRAGAAFGSAGNVERAVQEYETVAGMAGIDPRLSSLAELRIVMVSADTMEPDEMLERLQPLTMIGAPWRGLALEFEAAALLRKGEKDGAVETLRSLIDADSAPDSAKARAREMIAALGGTVEETTRETEQ